MKTTVEKSAGGGSLKINNWQPTEKQRIFLNAHEDEVFFGGSAGPGKMLDLNTPIPTPSGWSTMGDLKEGDDLFDEQGNVCQVTVAHPIEDKPESYELTFDCGEKIKACADHLWKTVTVRDINDGKPEGTIKNTKYIFETPYLVHAMWNRLTESFVEDYKEVYHDIKRNKHLIVSCKKVDPVPMRCISVNSKSNLFLAGKQMIPTHNSESLIIMAFLRCSSVKGAHVLYLRETFPDLEMSAIKRSMELFTGTGATYNAGSHKWKFPNGSVLQFGYLEKDDDVYRYHSAEFDLIIFDELTMFSEFRYTYMASRNRSTKSGLKSLMRSASNPGGPGHLWVKQRFIDVAPSNTTYRDKETGGTRRFIPALLTDNPHIMKNNPSYVNKLKGLPETRMKQLLEGDWSVAEGMAFSEFSPDIHVCEEFPIPSWWTRWRSNDPGYTDPFVWYWFACDQDGKVYVYREFTREPKEDRIVYSEQAENVVDMSIMPALPGSDEDDLQEESIEFTVCGRDAFSKHPESGKAIADYYDDGGVTDCIQPPRDVIQTDRKHRKAVLHEYLKPYKDENTGKYTAKLQIMDCCPKLIESLPNLPVDKRDPEKVADCNIDHWYDACLTGDTMVHTVEGNAKIKDMVGKEGLVVCFDEDRQEATSARYYDVRKTGYKDVFRVTTEGSSVCLTSDHSVLTNNGWKTVATLTADDKMLDISAGFQRIKSIEYLGKEDVYNMEVEKHHNFAVNDGLIVHNCGYGLQAWHTHKSEPPKEKESEIRKHKNEMAKKGKFWHRRVLS